MIQAGQLYSFKKHWSPHFTFTEFNLSAYSKDKWSKTIDDVWPSACWGSQYYLIQPDLLTNKTEKTDQCASTEADHWPCFQLWPQTVSQFRGDVWSSTPDNQLVFLPNENSNRITALYIVSAFWAWVKFRGVWKCRAQMTSVSFVLLQKV